MQLLSPARSAAFQVLRQVVCGGNSDELLVHRLSQLSTLDAGLATELVLGCLRREPQLDFLITHFAGKAQQLDTPVRIALRLGIYQLRYLDRIPAHAAVSESVEMVKAGRVHSAAGLVNAVLRKVHRGPVEWPSREVEFCLPEWLWKKWELAFGRKATEAIARAAMEPSDNYIRVPAGREAEAQELGATPTASPGCWKLHSPRHGDFRIQDIGSQSIVPLLDLRPRMQFLDLCAAPGNKTAQALESGVEAFACDVSLLRLAALKGLACHCVVADATRPLPFHNRFDRILIDAPCSGTGTIGRNPEIRWRVSSRDIARQQQRQMALLVNALDYLKPEGRLVYSTCSLEPEENENVVEAVLAGGKGFRLEQTVRRTPGEHPGDGFFAAVISST